MRRHIAGPGSAIALQIIDARRGALAATWAANAIGVAIALSACFYEHLMEKHFDFALFAIRPPLA